MAPLLQGRAHTRWWRGVSDEVARLEASVASQDFYASPIGYRLYHCGEAFNDEMDMMFHKRRGFSCEREFRLLRFNMDQYSKLVSSESRVEPLPEHFSVAWATSDVVEEVVISPYSSLAFERRARKLIREVDPELAKRMVLSELHERRYPVQR